MDIQGRPPTLLRQVSKQVWYPQNPLTYHFLADSGVQVKSFFWMQTSILCILKLSRLYSGSNFKLCIFWLRPCFVCKYLVGTLAWLLWEQSVPLELCYSPFGLMPFGIELFFLELCCSAVGPTLWNWTVPSGTVIWYLVCKQSFCFKVKAFEKWDTSYLNTLKVPSLRDPANFMFRTTVSPHVHF